jgi:hypothetical protein
MAMLSPVERSGLKLDVKTGEYLRYIETTEGGLGKYEVMFSPHTQTATQNCTSFIDKYLSWWEEYNKALHKQSQLIDNIVFPKKNGKSRLLGEYSIKGWGMEIGGNTCHLCGEGLLYSGINRTFIKNHRKVESQRVYTCGTTVFEQWKEYDVQPHEEKRKRHIHVGNDCISVD